MYDQANLYRLAESMLETGRFDEAERIADQILSRAPSDIFGVYFRAIARLYLQRAESAIPDLRQLAKAKGGPPGVFAHLAIASADLGLFDEALDAAKKLVTATNNAAPALELYRNLHNNPYFPASGIQSAHSPSRQSYMSNLVLRCSGDSLAVLELGTYMGASLFTWAAAAKLAGRRVDLHCIDAWDEADGRQYDALMAKSLSDGRAYRIFKNNLRHLPKQVRVTEWRGLSGTVLPRLAGNLFDIVYIDACHLHPEVHCDISGTMPLVKEGGYICGDDLEVQLHETDRAFAETNGRVDYVADPVTGRNFHPGVALGVGLHFGPVTCYRGFWVMQKRDGAFVPVDLTGKCLLPAHWPPSYRDQARQEILEDGRLEIVG